MGIYNSLLDRLKNQHQAIESIIAGVDKNRLLLQPAKYKWSIHDNIAHLAKYQPVFMGRVNLILTENTPAFQRYKAELDPEFETWRRRSTPELLRTLDSDRKKLYDLINGLKAGELNRTGEHPKFRTLTVVQWTEFFLLHEAHHMFTIFQLANDHELGHEKII